MLIPHAHLIALITLAELEDFGLCLHCHFGNIRDGCLSGSIRYRRLGIKLLTEADFRGAEPLPGLPDNIESSLSVLFALSIAHIDIVDLWWRGCGHGPVVASKSLVVAGRANAVSAAANMELLLDVLLILLLDHLVHFVQRSSILMPMYLCRGSASLGRRSRLLPDKHALTTITQRRRFIIGLLASMAVRVVTRLPLFVNGASLVRRWHDLLLLRLWLRRERLTAHLLIIFE